MKAKHFITTVLTLTLVLSLCSCSNKTTETSLTASDTESSAESSVQGGTSVVYADDNDWILCDYVDDNNHHIDKQYIKYEGIGTYSATVLDDLELEYVIVVDDEGIAFMLYERGGSLVHNNSDRVNDYSVSITEKGKDAVEYAAYMSPNGGDRIYLWEDTDQQRLLNDMKENKSLSFHIVDKNHSLQNYDFSLDTTGFAEAYQQLF